MLLLRNCRRSDGASTVLNDALPGIRWLYDDRALVSGLLGDRLSTWSMVNPGYRVMATLPLERLDELAAIMARLALPENHAGTTAQAPVLVLPRVFEPRFCAELIGYFEAEGGETSGFMREIDGVTRLCHDERHKRRQDRLLTEGPLKEAARARIARRLSPQIEKVFQFRASRIERYLVAAYDGQSGGWFRPHRDNTTKGTSHRLFAVSINLNSDFDGGQLRFPEYGMGTYRPPRGGGRGMRVFLLDFS